MTGAEKFLCADQAVQGPAIHEIYGSSNSGAVLKSELQVETRGSVFRITAFPRRFQYIIGTYLAISERRITLFRSHSYQAI